MKSVIKGMPGTLLTHSHISQSINSPVFSPSHTDEGNNLQICNQLIATTVLVYLALFTGVGSYYAALLAALRRIDRRISLGLQILASE